MKYLLPYEAIDRLHAEACEIFHTDDCPQETRDVIEWYHSALHVLAATPAAQQAEPVARAELAPHLGDAGRVIARLPDGTPRGTPVYLAAPAQPAPTARTDDEREADEYTIDRMAHLLAEIAVLVKGPERARHRHGFDDLPALVMELAAFKDRASAPVAVSDELVAKALEIWFMSDWTSHDDCMREILALAAGLQGNPDLEQIEQYRMQMAGISAAAIGYWKEGDSIHPDYDTPALRDVAKLYAKYDALYKSADRQGLINWVCERWKAEVANRPLTNKHRRSLDDTWRQVLRHLGADDVVRLGPRHDDLLAAQQGEGGGNG